MGDGPAIELTGLTKRYGPARGIDRLSLTVAPGEVFGFLGPNGAGKTTTLRCPIGLLRPSGGRVRVLGLDPIADHRRVTPYLGYLPGELRLYPELSGSETLDLLAALQGAPVPRRSELCDRLGLTPAVLARPVGGYSRGMKQKLGLVQAMQHDPRLAVLDEPTEGSTLWSRKRSSPCWARRPPPDAPSCSPATSCRRCSVRAGAWRSSGTDDWSRSRAWPACARPVPDGSGCPSRTGRGHGHRAAPNAGPRTGRVTRWSCSYRRAKWWGPAHTARTGGGRHHGGGGGLDEAFMDLYRDGDGRAEP
ncbi:ABC transporter ATP-binding protein [Streptomyces sp. NPDC085540]|uniref:ABC transporter ATP-binding protein n=1 Tax=Streptomyces sp. NPDC085540 TaxID=3365730 RepID=UPI0037D0ECCE